MIQAAKGNKKRAGRTTSTANTTNTMTPSKTTALARSEPQNHIPVPAETRRTEGETGHVDRIRDIIFGPQMRDYERRFQLIEKEVQRTLKNFQERLERTEKAMMDKLAKIASSADDAGAAAREVSSRLEDFRKATELDQRRLLAANEALKNELAKQMTRNYEQFNTRMEETREETRSAIEQLRNDQVHGMEELYRDKAGRSEMGELLIELGLRMKGEEILAT